MGKGDMKTKRGKIAKGTFGVSRPKRKNQPEKVLNHKEAKAKASK